MSRIPFALIFFMLIAGSTAVPSQAQGSIVQGDVPFAFIAGGKAFGPGKYKISKAMQQADIATDVFMISDHRQSAMFNATSKVESTAAKESGLIFQLIDGTYYLTGIRRRGETTSLSVVLPEKRRQMVAVNRATLEVAVP